MGDPVEGLDVGALAQRLVHLEVAFAAGGTQGAEQLFEGHLMKVAGKTQPIAIGFQAADGFLEGFFVSLADAHHLTDGPHLGAEHVRYPLELFEGPAGELHDDVVARRRVFFQGPVPPIGDFVQGLTAGQQRRHPGNRKTGGLGRKGRRPGGAGVYFDHHHPSGFGVVGKLDVGATDDLDGLHDVVGVLLKPLLKFGSNGEHGRRAETVAGVNAHGIDVLDKADGDHLVLGVTDHLQLELLPAQNRLFHQHLVYKARRQPAGCHRPQLFDVVYQPAAGSAHGVGRPNHHRIAELFGHLFGIRHILDRPAARHLDFQPLHGFLEGQAIFAALDGVHADADDLHAVGVENPLSVKFRGQVQPGLPSQVRQQGVGAFALDNLGKHIYIQRLDVCDIRHARIGHDGGRIGVDQHDFVAEGSQGLAGLGAGVVELAGLSDDDRPRADDQDLFDVGSSGHLPSFRRIERTGRSGRLVCRRCDRLFTKSVQLY